MKTIHELYHLENPSYSFEEIMTLVNAPGIDNIDKSHLITSYYKDYIKILELYPKYISYAECLNVDELIYLIKKCNLYNSWLSLKQIKLLLYSLPENEFINLMGQDKPIIKNVDLLKQYYIYYYYYINNLNKKNSKFKNYVVFLLENNQFKYIQQKPLPKDIVAYNLYEYFPEIKIDKNDILDAFYDSFGTVVGRRPYIPSISKEIMQELKDSTCVIYYILSTNLSTKEKSELILKYYNDINTIPCYLYSYYLNIGEDFNEYLEIKKFINSHNYKSFYNYERQLYSLNSKFLSLKSFLSNTNL